MSMLSDVEIKNVNMGKCLSIHVTGTFELMEKAVNQLFEWMEQKQIEQSGNLYTVFFDTVIEEGTQDAKFEVAIQVDRQIEGEDVIKCKDDIDQECAVISYTGMYEGINIAYETLLSWIEKNDYAINGATREVYIVRPKIGEYVDPKTFLTEIQIPVTKAE